MGRPPRCNPCCAPKRQGYCTHRQIDGTGPTVEWSASIDTHGGNAAVVNAVAFDSSGNVYVGGSASPGTGTLQKFNPYGQRVWRVNLATPVRAVTTNGTHV